MEDTTKYENPITTRISMRDTNNHNLNMFVWKNGNTDISLHDVISVVVGEEETMEHEDGTPFIVRDITIEHENGTHSEISLFIK